MAGDPLAGDTSSGDMLMQTASDIYITGLKNAHAMEHQALSIMKPQVKRIGNYEDVAAKLDQHIRETETQITRLETLLDEVGADRSAFKDAALSLGGSMAAIGHTFAPDEIVKNSIANHAFENYEIAAYESLIALAPHSGSASADGVLRQSLAEEVAMADWIRSNIGALTLKFAGLSAAGETTKK